MSWTMLSSPRIAALNQMYDFLWIKDSTCQVVRVGNRLVRYKPWISFYCCLLGEVVHRGRGKRAATWLAHFPWDHLRKDSIVISVA